MIRRRGGVRRNPGARMSELARRLEMRNPPFHPDFLVWVIQPSTPSPHLRTLLWEDWCLSLQKAARELRSKTSRKLYLQHGKSSTRETADGTFIDLVWWKGE